jgi:serine protease Do
MSGVASVISGRAAQALGTLAERLRQSTVQVRAGQSGGGSGVIWRSDGLIVTNAHVARGKRLAVELADGTLLRARLTDRDDGRDVAALRVDASGLPAATIGDSDTLRPGHLAFAVGNPFGVVGAVTSGIVFAAGSSGGRGVRWIQADVRIAPGNSGGPLADARGHVVGINSMIYGGLAIAVPSNTIVRFLGGTSARPRFGVVVEPVALRAGGRSSMGLLVFEIGADSDAERGGVLPGDVIVRIGAHGVRSPEDLPDALALAGSGGALQLTVLRGGVERDLSIVLRAAGADAAA